MRRALALAATAAGKTFPNPVVGCVIVDERSGVVVGEGYHPKAGEPHAEVFALRAAGANAKGCTAYVTLEPCDHFGRTPPCSRALVDAGVTRVVVGFVDPDPRVSGGGIRTLLDAGIEVCVGCCEEECREINADFVSFGRGDGDDSPSKDLRPRLGGMNGDAKKTRNSNVGMNRAGDGANGGGTRFVKGLVTQVHSDHTADIALDFAQLAMRVVL